MTRVAVLYVVATAQHPVTVDEISDRMDVSYHTLRKQVRWCYQNGYLGRVKRRTDNGGDNPYEYVVAPHGEQ